MNPSNGVFRRFADLSCAVEPEDVRQAFSAVKGGQALPSNGVAGGKLKDGRSNDRGSTRNGHGSTSNGHGSTSNGHGSTSNGHGSTSNGHGSTSNGHGSISSEMGQCGGQFASILEPAGLLMEYEGDFENSGLDFQVCTMSAQLFYKCLVQYIVYSTWYTFRH